MYKKLEVNEMFDLSQTIAADLFEGVTYGWEVLPKIKDFIIALGERLPKDKFEEVSEHVWIAKSATIAPTASITGPVIIDEDAEIRHCAFIRGNAIVGKGAVVGNSTELKNVILFDKVQVPHYNYVGDSVLGFKAHTFKSDKACSSAGSITSNIKSDRTNVAVMYEGEKVETGLRKIGAIVGDGVEVGCNAVLNPGTVVGRNSMIYPLSMVRGYVAENSIYKKAGEVITKQ